MPESFIIRMLCHGHLRYSTLSNVFDWYIRSLDRTSQCPKRRSSSFFCVLSSFLILSVLVPYRPWCPHRFSSPLRSFRYIQHNHFPVQPNTNTNLIAIQKMEVGDDPYQLLGVPTNADYATIKKNYRKLALQQHPDKGGDPKRFAQIANAYEILSDPPQRHNYDLQQSHGSSKGYDPKAPEFTTTQEDYDPSKEQTAEQQPRQWQNNSNNNNSFGSSSPHEWTTSSSTPSGTTTQTFTKTYTTSSCSPGKQSTRRTTTTNQMHQFVDPMELFRQHFPEAALHHNMTSPSSSKSKQTKMKTKTKTNTSSTVPTKSMGNMSMKNDHNGGGGGGGGGDSNNDKKEIMGMASSTRTVTHPNGQQELITETVITRMDGSTETTQTSVMMPGSSKNKPVIATSKSKPLGKMTDNSGMMIYPMSPTPRTTTTTKSSSSTNDTMVNTTLKSPIKKTKIPKNSSSSTTTSGTTTTGVSGTVVMKSPTSNKSTSTTKSSTSTMKSPEGNSTSNNNNNNSSSKTIVIKNGIPIKTLSPPSSSSPSPSTTTTKTSLTKTTTKKIQK